MRFDDKARENLEAVERLLARSDDGEVEPLSSAAAARAYYAAYLAVADRAQRGGLRFDSREANYYRHDTLPGRAQEWGSLRPIRKEMEAVAGGPVIVIFHTRAESARLHSDFVKQALLAKAAFDVDSADRVLDAGAPSLGTDVALRPRAGDPGTGSSALPRKAA
jgi:hypothetical protein